MSREREHRDVNYFDGNSRKRMRGVWREREHGDVEYLDGNSRERVRGVGRKRERKGREADRQLPVLAGRRLNHSIGLRPMLARLGGRPTDRTDVACIGSKRNQGENVPPTLALFARNALFYVRRQAH